MTLSEHNVHHDARSGALRSEARGMIEDGRVHRQSIRLLETRVVRYHSTQHSQLGNERLVFGTSTRSRIRGGGALGGGPSFHE